MKLIIIIIIIVIVIIITRLTALRPHVGNILTIPSSHIHLSKNFPMMHIQG